MNDRTQQGAGLWWALGLFLLVPAAIGVRYVLVGTFANGATTVLHGLSALGVPGTLALAGLQIVVAVSGVLPAAALAVAAGSLFGLMLGFAVAAGATLAGAWVAFALSRSAWRPLVACLLARKPRLQALDALLAGEGWRVVLLLRVSPIMPFSATSYALGLSGVSPRDYALGTLACLPALFGYVALGAMAKAGVAASAATTTPIRLLLLAIGAVMTLIFVVRVSPMVAALLNAAQPSLGDRRDR